VYSGTFHNPRGDSVRSRVFEWTRDGTLQRSWTVPGQDLDEAHGVQVATSDARGRLVLLERSTSRALRLDRRTGRFTRYASFPDLPVCLPGQAKGCSPNLVDKPAVPNFAAWGPDGELYVTDYGQAVVWRVPPGGGKARVWLADRRLDGVELGTTGLLLAPNRRALLVAQQTSVGLGDGNPATCKLYRIPIRNGRPGAVRLLWESLPGDLPDGFGIGRSGRIYLANAGLSAQLVVLSPEGEEVERFPEAPAHRRQRQRHSPSTPRRAATFVGRRVLVREPELPRDRREPRRARRRPWVAGARQARFIPATGGTAAPLRSAQGPATSLSVKAFRSSGLRLEIRLPSTTTSSSSRCRRRCGRRSAGWART